MSAVLRTAALVVGAVAAVATAIPSAGTSLGAYVGLSGAAFAGAATLAATGLSLAAMATAKKIAPSFSGARTTFRSTV